MSPDHSVQWVNVDVVMWVDSTFVVVYYDPTYLFIYKFSCCVNVVIMSVHDSEQFFVVVVFKSG